MIEEVAPAAKKELKILIIMTHMFATLSLRASATEQSRFLTTHTFSQFYTHKAKAGTGLQLSRVWWETLKYKEC